MPDNSTPAPDDKSLTGDFAKATVVIYAPDAASQKAAQAAKDLIEKNGGSVDIRRQQAPYNYPGIH